MKSFAGKLVLSALGLAILATPVLARQRHGHVYAHAPQHRYHAPQYGYTYSPQYGYTYTPPPPQLLYAPQSGNTYTPIYVPGFGNIGSSGHTISGGGPN
jgi:hypothetical protein